MAIVYEIAKYDMRYFIDNVINKNMDYDIIKDIIYELFYSIYLMHRNLIIHRDLKPENILIKIKNKNNINSIEN